MTFHRARGALASVAVLVALVGLTVAVPSAAARPSGSSASTTALANQVHIFPQAIRLNPPAEFRLRRGAKLAAVPPTYDNCVLYLGIGCYDPAELQAVYNLAPLYAEGISGQGQTIVIVDAFGSPTIGQDLKYWDSYWGLPNPPHFAIIAPAGPIPAWNPKDGTRLSWAGETTLDVEWAHSLAPQANILVVETPGAEGEGISGFPQIQTAEDYVISHKMGGVISQSFGATEPTLTVPQILSLRKDYLAAATANVTVVSASGDAGSTDYTSNGNSYYKYPVTDWPASDPLVTSIGGTTVNADSTGTRYGPDTVWNDSYNSTVNYEFYYPSTGPNPIAGGGGRSFYFGRPSYQDGVANVVGNHRGVPDISMSAACVASVWTYESFDSHPGFYPTCGTSEATPEFAAIVALADQEARHWLGDINPRLYNMSARNLLGIQDVTSGNNAVSWVQNGTQYNVSGYYAGTGYDLASGIGTVADATLFVPELAGLWNPFR